MNRCFFPEFMNDPDCYEGQRCKLIADLLKDRTLLLDLHATSAPTPSFCIPAHDPVSESFATKLPIKAVVTGLAHLLVAGGATMDIALEYGKVGVAVECGQQGNHAATATAKAVIRAVVDIEHRRHHELKVCVGRVQSICRTLPALNRP